MGKPELESDLRAADHQDESNDTFRWMAYEAPEQTRCGIMQSMWRDRLLIRVMDMKSGEVMIASEPLFRFFTISHEWIARKLERNHGGGPVGKKEVEAQAEKILNSIRASVQSNHGVVPDEDVDTDVCSQFPFVQFRHDGFIIGLFFSSDSRNTATHEILANWKGWGVGEEVNPTEIDERQEWRESCQQCFDESEFLPQFQDMSHEERLAEIHSLWRRGIGFEMTAQDTDTKYSSVGGVSYFYVDYLLGTVNPSERLEFRNSPPDQSIFHEYFEFLDDQQGDRMRKIVQIERAVQDAVEVNGGEVFVFQREIHENDEGNIEYEGPCSTLIGCRFPTAAIRNQVARDVWDSWGMYGLTIDEETREAIMHLNERVAYVARMSVYGERDPERRKQLCLMKGSAFDEVKDRVINAQIAEWESTREGNAN